MIRKLLLVLFLGIATAAPSRAAIIVTVGDVALNPAQPTGTLAVYAQTDSGTVGLGAFSLGLQITPNRPGSTGQVAFVNPPTDGQFGNANYVFFGNSAADPGPSGGVITTVYADDTYIGGDGTTAPGGEVTLGTTPQLLALLDLTMLTGSPPTPGETFSVSVLDDGSTMFMTGGTAPELIPFTSNVGTVTTPEPATLMVFGGLAAVGFGLVRRRRVAT